MCLSIDGCCIFAQETTADELEEAYRGEVWNPARGHTEEQKQGITAARLELRTMTQECKVTPTHMLTVSGCASVQQHAVSGGSRVSALTALTSNVEFSHIM